MSGLQVLIQAVQERRALWDPAIPEHKDRHHVAALWDEVAVILGCEREVVKTKWRSIRDYYRQEQKKNNRQGPNAYRSSWVHYDSMSFLNAVVPQSRRYDSLINHLHQGAEPVYEAAIKVEDSIELEPEGGNEICLFEPSKALETQLTAADSPPLSTISLDSSKDQHVGEPSSVFPSRKYPKLMTEDEEIRNIKRRKLFALEKIVDEAADDDLQFFKSLIPDLKDLPRSKKVYIRLKIQELIFNEVYGANSSQ